MSYGLSFTPVFFTALDRAVRAVPMAQWDQWCADSDCPVQAWMSSGDVVSLAVEENTCTDLQTPVEVWLDSEGIYTVEVYPLAHYVELHPDILDDDDPAVVEVYEDGRRCECRECKGGGRRVRPPRGSCGRAGASAPAAVTVTSR